MGMRRYAVLVEDTASEESTAFEVEASSAFIACTRAASRLFGPEAETRPVYGCAVCGEELWEGGRLDSSGLRFCDACSPDELESHAEQEPVGLIASTGRISAIALTPLPGDAPLGPVQVVVADPRGDLVPGDAFEDDEAARAALERALGDRTPLGDALGDLTVRDEAGAYFGYGLRPVALPVDAHDLVARGLIDEEAGEEDEEGTEP
jgi:hypothetical protein